MKMQRPYPQAVITPKGERALASGHPWVYEGEVVELGWPGSIEPALDACGSKLAPQKPGCTGAQDAAPRPIENGALVDVVSRKGSYLGTGLLSLQSKIRVRLVSRNANDRFDDAFWERKVRWAWEYRKTVMGADAGCCRVIFSEADGFPGLIVDRFGDVLVAQVLSVGMERRKGVIFSALMRVLSADGISVRGIYERNDVSTRALEGLDEACGWWHGAGGDTSAGRSDDAALMAARPARAGQLGDGDVAGCGGAPGATVVEICENGVRYLVDFEHGQKTGFFLDQKYNRRAVGALATGRRVLDCFTHTGSFGLNAVRGGAAHVHAVDISETAVEMARTNARLNSFESRMSFETANVFDLLPELEHSAGRRGGRASDGAGAPDRGEPFDFIVLDPPAFTKSRRTVASAERGYHEINQRAMKILPRGGYLATCSCSHFMDAERFRHMLASAAHDANVQLRQIEERQQAPDHPILWGVPETSYLKFFLFQVV